ncbi:uncharacterized protein (DUF1015 family) [Motilibacter peucedani]|uniref:Uncharacterized protein (DUF1015 family) n=1 Tax=Motilibacter peucedani TaxID=598650 RepID=A0A420XPG8_9ACTN|nr:DUF1015 family protein [Motilibacter peucedani]RKS74074.1 uncharacterized protein (DUF1015 family) [Motilibacter peucedani]
MVDLAPMRALRPVPAAAARVLAPPYDVVDVASARALAGDPDSFLHVSRPEIDLPDAVDPADQQVYAAAGAALERLVAREVLRRDPAPAYFAYRRSDAHGSQTGLVGCASVDDYESGVIATHESTRPDKELDRVRHVDAVDAHDEPVFLIAPPTAVLREVIATATAGDPETDAVAHDGVRHQVWPVTSAAAVEDVRAALAALPRAYVADGHHRSAAAARVRRLRRERGQLSPGADAFLAVLVPADDVRVLAYDRLVLDTGGLPAEELPAALRAAGFTVAETDDGPGGGRPQQRHCFGVRVGHRWWTATTAPGSVNERDPVASLDVALLQDRVLEPLLGIRDPRTEPRLAFVGGEVGTDALAGRADAVAGSVAFALHPTSVAELVACADAGVDMPPKSTWFDPKLGSGLFVHPLG